MGVAPLSFLGDAVSQQTSCFSADSSVFHNDAWVLSVGVVLHIICICWVLAPQLCALVACGFLQWSPSGLARLLLLDFVTLSIWKNTGSLNYTDISSETFHYTVPKITFINITMIFSEQF